MTPVLFAHGGQGLDLITVSGPLGIFVGVLASASIALIITALIYLVPLFLNRRKKSASAPETIMPRKDKRHLVINWLVISGALTVVTFFGIVHSETVVKQEDTQTISQPESRIAPSATVTLSSAGSYEPATVTIKAGQAVRFVNASKGLAWPASNPHPSHTDLPGFDPRKVLQVGDSWQFTFTRAGKWGYHDHLNPARRGTVIVTN